MKVKLQKKDVEQQTQAVADFMGLVEVTSFYTATTKTEAVIKKSTKHLQLARTASLITYKQYT